MRKELIAQRDPKSPVSETFRTLRTNIQFMNTNNQLKTLLITSTLPGEGKSWVASNLAITFAQAGKKVVLIDADMRKGRQYTIFEVSPRPGLSNYLSGIDSKSEENSMDEIIDYIQETEVKNLYVISAGNIPPNPSELLITPKMVNLLDKLKQVSDIVIIDGTPCELVTDSVILSRLVDSTVIVTAHKQTKKDTLQKIVTNIQNVGGKIAGIVLNKIPVSAKKYEQSYYYGSTSMKNERNSKGPRYTTSSSHGRRTKMEEMKNRVKPQNPQALRNERERLSKDEDTLQRKIHVDDKANISEDKAKDIFKQINDFMDSDKENN
ncbi:MAG: CpsD/CapB family tyrosine-protein kinase [Clostridia bacterium]|nr:CpsD/CapB family tyrosine-protein kinase [Clostridium sp.]